LYTCSRHSDSRFVLDIQVLECIRAVDIQVLDLIRAVDIQVLDLIRAVGIHQVFIYLIILQIDKFIQSKMINFAWFLKVVYKNPKHHHKAIVSFGLHT